MLLIFMQYINKLYLSPMYQLHFEWYIIFGQANHITASYDSWFPILFRTKAVGSILTLLEKSICPCIIYSTKDIMENSQRDIERYCVA